MLQFRSQSTYDLVMVQSHITAQRDDSPHVCGVCGANAPLHDVLDFNTSCSEQKGGVKLPRSGKAIYYARCVECGFTFAPELCNWTLEQFAHLIYNEDYVAVDPEFLDIRPRVNAAELLRMIPDAPATMRHLDFGGGSGLMSTLLFDAGWDSRSYDPFYDRGLEPRSLGTFDLITAFEVFEHVPDVGVLADDLSSLLAPQGVLLFTTLLSDGNLSQGTRITWWYAAPRNGHISLFTREALSRVASRMEMRFGSFTDAFHAYWRGRPSWATFLPE